jgi:hypothetical protein
MFTSFQVQYPLQCICISGVLAAISTAWFLRWYRRSEQLHFGLVGTVALTAVAFVALFLTVFFGVL